MFSLATAGTQLLFIVCRRCGCEGKVNCIHSTWGRAVKFYVETKYDLDPHRAASNPAQVSSAPAGHQALHWQGGEAEAGGTVLGKYSTVAIRENIMLKFSHLRLLCHVKKVVYSIE